MKYQVIVLDLDGTLTNSKKEITPPTRDALIEIQQMTGKIAYYKSIQPDYTNHVLKKYSSKYNSTWDILIKEAMNRTI